MKKVVTLFLFSLLLSFGAKTYAQLPANSYAPDFTLVDINGTSHHLYSYLDSGYTVIMDVSAIWCGPCWSYHNTHALKDLYLAHGPAGTNNVRVFFVEGDQGTLAQLNGGAGSQGDWVTGTPYPIIPTYAPNGTSICTNYQIGYFPTVYKICPDRVVNEVGQISAAQLWTSAQACPAPSTNTLDVKVFSYEDPIGSYCGSSITPKLKIQNYGSATLTTLNIISKVDGVVKNTYPWTGSLAKYSLATVTLPTITGISDGAHTFTYELSAPNAGTDQDLSNNTQNSSFSMLASGTTITVKITPDSYPGEVSWDIKEQGTSTIIASGALTAGGLYTKSVCTDPTKCYTFTIYDAYGDGMLSPGVANIMNGTQVLATIVGTSYTTQSSVNFCITTDVDEYSAINGDISIYPNPFGNTANVNFNLKENSNVVLSVFDLVGKKVYENNYSELLSGNQNLVISSNDLQSGLYFVTLQIGNSLITKRVSVIK